MVKNSLIIFNDSCSETVCSLTRTLYVDILHKSPLDHSALHLPEMLVKNEICTFKRLSNIRVKISNSLAKWLVKYSIR